MARDGGCLCGAIRYRVEGEPTAVGICHCETCRRAASAPSLPFCTIARQDVTLLRGMPVSYRSSPHVSRSFCGACGSPLFYANDREPAFVDVMTCSLDDPDGVPPQFAVWTGETLSWDSPNPACPHFARSRQEG